MNFKNVNFNNSCPSDISFSHKVQMLKARMNLFLNIPVYSLISLSNIKYENKVNNQLLLHATYQHKQ